MGTTWCELNRTKSSLVTFSPSFNCPLLTILHGNSAVFSIDPNATVAETWWFQKSPWSLTSRVSWGISCKRFVLAHYSSSLMERPLWQLATSCQPETFAIGSRTSSKAPTHHVSGADKRFVELTTSSGGVLYTLLSVTSPDSTSQATLPYLNNAIFNCQLESMTLVWTNESIGYKDNRNSRSVSVSLREV